MSLSVCLSVSVSVCLSVCLSVFLLPVALHDCSCICLKTSIIPITSVSCWDCFLRGLSNNPFYVCHHFYRFWFVCLFVCLFVVVVFFFLCFFFFLGGGGGGGGVTFDIYNHTASRHFLWNLMRKYHTEENNARNVLHSIIDRYLAYGTPQFPVVHSPPCSSVY